MAKYETLRKFSHAKTGKTYEVGESIDSDKDFSRAIKKGFVKHLSGDLPETAQEQRVRERAEEAAAKKGQAPAAETGDKPAKAAEKPAKGKGK